MHIYILLLYINQVYLNAQYLIIAPLLIFLWFNFDCSNVLIQGLTILAPVDSPNTDGIDPGLFQCNLLYIFSISTTFFQCNRRI
jgi:polygalacturonase